MTKYTYTYVLEGKEGEEPTSHAGEFERDNPAIIDLLENLMDELQLSSMINAYPRETGERQTMNQTYARALINAGVTDIKCPSLFANILDLNKIAKGH